MAERGHTSSMTSVTEYDSSVGSESDTTESSVSNITSSVLSSTDTDDKLTPSLGGISISALAQNAVKTCKNNNKKIKTAMSSTRTLLDDIAQSNSDRNFASNMNAVPKKRKLKEKHLLHSALRSPYSNLNCNTNALCDEDNLGVTDKDNKLSTDFSDTSSVAVAKDRTSGQLRRTENEDSSEEEANDYCMEPGGGDVSAESVDCKQSWEPDMSSSTWYQAGCFDRYWSHYGFVMAWYRAHMNAVHKLHKDMLMNKREPWRGGGYSGAKMDPRQMSQHASPHTGGKGRSNSFRHNRRARRARSRRCAKARRKAASIVASNSVSGGPSLNKNDGTDLKSVAQVGEEEEGEEEEAEVEMEITEDMMEFFTTSLKHRMERDVAKTSSTAKEGVPETRVSIEDAAPGQSAPSTAPPQERPGARRAQEMKQLYGSGAPMIHGMETALQMTFDRIQDKFQPKLWPNMPLKIVFG